MLSTGWAVAVDGRAATAKPKNKTAGHGFGKGTQKIREKNFEGEGNQP